jgi:hypothetical protein
MRLGLRESGAIVEQDGREERTSNSRQMNDRHYRIWTE